MSESTYGGGREVKASTLVVGNTIRDPKRIDRILIVEETGTQIYCRGYEAKDTGKHVFLSPDTYVTLVTQASTETTQDTM